MRHSSGLFTVAVLAALAATGCSDKAELERARAEAEKHKAEVARLRAELDAKPKAGSTEKRAGPAKPSLTLDAKPKAGAAEKKARPPKPSLTIACPDVLLIRPRNLPSLEIHVERQGFAGVVKIKHVVEGVGSVADALCKARTDWSTWGVLVDGTAQGVPVETTSLVLCQFTVRPGGPTKVPAPIVPPSPRTLLKFALDRFNAAEEVLAASESTLTIKIPLAHYVNKDKFNRNMDVTLLVTATGYPDNVPSVGAGYQAEKRVVLRFRTP
jgi:hypothetical protein